MTNFQLTPILRPIAFAAGTVLLLVWSAVPALAETEIEEAQVEGGKVEIENHGAWFGGLPSSGVNYGLENEVERASNELSAIFGLNDYFSIGVEIDIEKPRNEMGSFDDLQISQIGFESKLVLLPRIGDGIGITMYLGYEQGVQSGDNSKLLTFGPIINLAKGPFSTTVNLFFARAFELKELVDAGPPADYDTTPATWGFEYHLQAKYQMSERFAFGVESIGTILDIGGRIAGRIPQTHSVGPVVYFTMGDNNNDDAESSAGKNEGVETEIALGLLFGLTSATYDVALKWDVTVGF